MHIDVVIIYTDAAEEGGKVRIGALVLVPEATPRIIVYDPPSSITQMWGEGLVRINQAELHAAPVVTATLPELLKGRDVIWFLDNTSAEAALVKAGSPTQSMASLALVATATLARLRARVWFDHVPSSDNPADVLSREAGGDPEVARKLASGEWLAVPAVEPQWERGLDFEFW